MGLKSRDFLLKTPNNMLKAVFLFASQLWKPISDSHCVHDKTPHVSVFFNGEQTPANSGGLLTFCIWHQKTFVLPMSFAYGGAKITSLQSLANVWSRRQGLPRSGVNIYQTYRVEDWWPQAVGWVKSHSIHSIHSIPSSLVIHDIQCSLQCWYYTSTSPLHSLCPLRVIRACSTKRSLAHSRIFTPRVCSKSSSCKELALSHAPKTVSCSMPWENGLTPSTWCCYRCIWPLQAREPKTLMSRNPGNQETAEEQPLEWWK